MGEWKLRAPVALVIFKRPDTTAKVFAEIARARPDKLLVVADGPREDRAGEAQQCADARRIIEQVDWPCEVLKNYSDKNLGCRQRVSSGLNWVFQTVEEAIILEDDCVPHPTFFRFCDEILEKYRQDTRIMHVSGDNYQFGRKRGVSSYYFSRYPHVWGWACWRRAWKYYDVAMTEWAATRQKNQYLDQFDKVVERRYWKHNWDLTCAGRIDTWDYQWSFSCLAQGGLAVMPNVNLVSNIGFGSQATHTKIAHSVANLPVEEIVFPLVHPATVARDVEADEFTSEQFLELPGLVQRVSNRIRWVSGSK